ncbi:MAG TPA: hypothetical protein GXX35_04250 [Thermoanaerobacterales bacterium]|nr:hypothetical protein [Thermoanaerobacterales bacterium]
MNQEEKKKVPPTNSGPNPYTLFLILILLINSTGHTCIFAKKDLNKRKEREGRR